MAAICNSEAAGVSTAMKKCPFLHNIAQKHGEDYASSLAGCPAGRGAVRQPLLAEDCAVDDFSSTFALFHGRGGVLPLPHLLRPEPKILYPAGQPIAEPQQESPRSRCPLASGTSISRNSGFPHSVLAAAPLASMSMSWGSNWFNIHHLFQQHMNQHRAKQQRKSPQQPQQSRTGPQGGTHGPGLGGLGTRGVHMSSADGGGGKCPLRKALGPLAGIVFNKHGHLSCPEPIVKMRAALAATRPVRELRPQALPVKLLAVAMTTAALNVPCGMWREHTEKFSSQWFIAVHATIPFIAMLRKAVIMPKYAILFTICAAIAGQAMGAKIERKRLVAHAKAELGGLAKASAVTLPRPPPWATAAAGAAVAGRQQAGAGALPVASMLLSAQHLDRSAGCGVGSMSAGIGDGGGGVGADATATTAICTGQDSRVASGFCVPGREAEGASGFGMGAGACMLEQQQQLLQFSVRLRSGQRPAAGAVSVAGRGETAVATAAPLGEKSGFLVTTGRGRASLPVAMVSAVTC